MLPPGIRGKPRERKRTVKGVRFYLPNSLPLTCTNTSFFPFVSLGTRFVAIETNATMRREACSPESEGLLSSGFGDQAVELAGPRADELQQVVHHFARVSAALFDLLDVDHGGRAEADHRCRNGKDQFPVRAVFCHP